MTYLRPFEPLWGPEQAVRGDLLVLAPHPDDEVIGCGGLMAMHRDRGMRVRAVVMTDGGRGDPARGVSGDDYRRLREAEAREAAERIGGVEIEFLGGEDGALAADATVPAELARILDEFKPTTLAFPSPFEVHPDHRATALHAAAALGLATHRPPRILAFEVGGFQPANVVLDVTAWADRKARAIEAYASQLAHMDIVAKVRALNLARTVNVDIRDVRACEAYALIRPADLDAYFAAAEVVIRIVDGAHAP